MLRVITLSLFSGISPSGKSLGGHFTPKLLGEGGQGAGTGGIALLEGNGRQWGLKNWLSEGKFCLCLHLLYTTGNSERLSTLPASCVLSFAVPTFLIY